MDTEEQRKHVRNFSKTIDEQTEQIKQKDEILLKQNETITETIDNLGNTKNKLAATENKPNENYKEISTLKNTTAQLEKEHDYKSKKLDLYNKLFFDTENRRFYSTIDNFPLEVITKVNKLKEDNLIMEFLGIAKFIENGGMIGTESLDKMKQLGLAFEVGARPDLTPIGNIIYHYRNILIRNN